MKLIPDSSCNICNLGSPGTVLHMFWDCPVIATFWKHVANMLSVLLGFQLLPEPCLFLLNDDSRISLSSMQCKILLVGLTAAKKVILKLWIEPSTALANYWLTVFRDIVSLERATARLNGARPGTVETWDSAFTSLAKLLME